jgi:melibiose permease/lactose/raffinose/galactose permease
MSIMQMVSAVGYFFMLSAGLLMGPTMTKFIIITIGYMLANFGQYCFYLIMMISIINTVEYHEYTYGSRNEAIITSLRPFLTKLASALVVAITSVSYMVFGVTGFSNRISDMENQTARKLITEAEKLSSINTILQEVQKSQTKGLLIVFTVVPLVLMYLSYLIYKRKYRLDEGEYDRICAELAKRKAAK